MLGSSLVQTGECITKCGNFITKLGKHNYKAGQPHIITKGQEILKSGAVNSLQSGTIYKKGHVLQKRPLYYKV